MEMMDAYMAEEGDGEEEYDEDCSDNEQDGNQSLNS